MIFLVAVMALAGAARGAWAETKAAQVVVVRNTRSALSRNISEYYVRSRGIPARNLCDINTSDKEEIDRRAYDDGIAKAVGKCLRSRGLVESTLYIVTTMGVPLRIAGSEGMGGDMAAVDSELALLYADLHGGPHRVNGIIPNPFFAKTDAEFRHPDFPIYLVTRLAGYDFSDVRGMVDRAKGARNRGRFVIDMAGGGTPDGEKWLFDATLRLPSKRVLLDDSTQVVHDQEDVIGYASWGSNDKNRKRRMTGFKWLSGAIATEYVSSNGRTFARPPDDWRLGKWTDPRSFFAGTPQSLSADYIHEGVTGVSGHVAEPFLAFCPRPNVLLPAYWQGRTLAESYYLAIPGLSWQNIVVGDPLCSLGKPQ